ncbi:MAG: DUF2612 domain-containing protein [bacterium]|nr:DUF2612 domain-containing protein [bacterium]
MTLPTEKGIDRLAFQFEDSPKFIDYLEAFLVEYDELQTSGTELMDERAISTAEGVQLDICGVIVGLERPIIEGVTLGDEPYRLFLKAKARINSTNMTVDETLDILSFMIPSTSIWYRLIVSLYPTYTFTRILTATEVFALTLLPDLICIDPEYVHYDEATTQSFAEDPTGLGMGTIANPATGGNLASIIL